MPAPRLCLHLAALAAALAAACPAQEPVPPDDEGNSVALRVNAHTIGTREVEALFYDSFLIIQEKLRSGDLKPELKQAAVREAWLNALQTSIQDHLLDDLGAKFRSDIKARIVASYSPSTPSSRIEDAYKRWEGDMVERMRKELVREAGGEKALRDALAKRGETWQQWEKGIVLEIYRREVLFYTLGRVRDTLTEARKYYEEHPDQFGHPDGWTLRRIRIPKAKFTTPEEAEQTAQLVYKKVTEGGVEFAKVAAALQYDPAVDKFGGMLTVDGKTGLPSGNFPAEERIAKDLKDGEVSKPVDAGDAYLIVKREAYRKALKIPWEEAADRARGLAYSENLRKMKQEFFEKQKNDAYIEILKKDPPARWTQ
ncbi:MAG: peptidyl-prolyl cis-trans isomerase [Planctomycetota bacterium]|nr:peptidyl-prolyl cis-trans isomerase [Planctomycetota bacterium]